MIYDISQTLRADLPVWPGDTRFSIERTWAIAPAVPVNVSALNLSTHSGTHADAPFHYNAAGSAIDGVDLSPYIGRAQVVDARNLAGPIGINHILHQLVPAITRVLIRTYDQAPQDRWDESFAAIDADLISALAERDVRLIGTDTPSLDPQDSKTMDAHLAVDRHGLAILEGLVLDRVPFGVYELIALPLKIAGADASPVRAILRSL